ncbi:anthocyanidin 3-O-glucosyltransferase-like [Panicum hallii]|uniref:anthocyanidin 3-O-glucosyltransferase-like n=1 Tax=Panicum hallii TaxID=206008 RepID=UPI000DF4E3BF|nr:anthocyanidin 3-O-glucosyltransferase-like [Panicum hallii]
MPFFSGGGGARSGALLSRAPPPTGDPHGCLAWLDAHPARSVAYVSLGTVASPCPDKLRELATGLASSGPPFLWSLREGSWPLLPAGFLARAAAAVGRSGLVVPWAPQVAVLRHASSGVCGTAELPRGRVGEGRELRRVLGR